MPEIRLNKTNKTIKVVNRRNNIKLSRTRGNIKLQHTGRPGPASDVPGPAGVGTPEGGLIGQVLQKASSDNYDFSWMTPSFEDKNFVHNFTVSQSIIVEHQLHKYPSVTVIDSAGDNVYGDVEYIDTNSIQVKFSAPFSGQIICN